MASTRRLATILAAGKLEAVIGKAKEKWGKLTDNDWKVVEGKRDQLVRKVQERYGIAREEAKVR